MKQLNDKITFRNGATVNNRIIQTPMLTNSGVNEEVCEDTIRYYAARSRSAGMVVVEYTNVSPNGGPSRSWQKTENSLPFMMTNSCPVSKRLPKH